MNTRIIMSFRVLFACPINQYLVDGCRVCEARYTATKDIDLLEIPKEGIWIEDGPLKMQLCEVRPSLEGPRFICHADCGYSYGWNDMGGVPNYYGLVDDAKWFSVCERHGWKMELQGELGPLNERYPNYARGRKQKVGSMTLLGV